MLKKLALTLPFLLAGIASADTLVSVQEADRFTIHTAEGDREVRLYGADAPETGQTFSEEAKAFVSGQLKGTEFATKKLAVDNTGLDVVEVSLPGGALLHVILMEAGLAWWDENNAPADSVLKKVNAEAISGPKGIWKDATALAPWDYRKSAGLPQVTYSVSSPTDEKMAKLEPVKKEEEKEKKKEIKDLKLNGEGKYLQVPESLTTAIQTYAPDVNMGEVNTELQRYGVRFATDASGAPLGITADVANIPGASAMGFQPGDVLSSINGMPATSESQIMAIAAGIAIKGGGGTVNATIVRNGQPVNISVPIPKF